MPDADKSISLTKAAARPIWLRAQRLDTETPFGDGPQATAAAVEHLGYVQIDTIHVIERCHHHILWNRIPEYRRADLRQAQSVDKSVFEYWTHALSYVPASDLRFFIPAMKRHRREGHKWLCVGHARRTCARSCGLIRQRWRVDDPRYRRRCAGGEGTCLGQSQAIETGAATGVLRRPGHDLRAQRHAQDL